MDNFDNNIKNNLEDKAWASMKDILDKELPEVVAPTLSDGDEKEKKKRRFLFFFLFLLGLIGSGLGYYFYAQNNNVNSSKNQFVNSEKIINKTEKISHSKDVVLQKNGSNTEEVNFENNNLIQSNKTSDKLNKKNLIYSSNKEDLLQIKNTQNIDNQLVTTENTNDLVDKNNTQNKSITELNKPNSAIEKDINSNIKSDINIANLTLNKTETARENKIVIEAKKDVKEEPYIATIKSISSTDLIDILQPKPIYFDTKNALNKDYNALKKISIIDSKKWSYGLVLGLNTEGSVNTIGGGGGAFVQRNLNTKWSLNIGLNYRFLSKNESEKVRKIEYLQSADVAADKLTTVSTTTGLLKVKKAYLQSLQYLEIPIQINYHLNRKIYFYSGGKIAYLVAQNIASNAFINNASALYVPASTVYTAKSAERLVADQNYTSNDLGLDKLDIGLIGGVNYRLNKHFSMELRYDFGLSNIYQSNIYQIGNVITANNRFMGLNMAYRF